MKYLVVVEGAIALHIEGMKSAGEPIPAMNGMILG